MTDIKANPATDRKPCPFCGVNVPFVQDPSTKFIDSSWIEHPNNWCRIGRKMYLPEWNTRPQEAADAEIIKAREAAYDQAQEGLKNARKQESEMRETIRAKAEEIERLETLTTEEVHTLRAQVETLREALLHARHRNHAHAPRSCDGCAKVEAATEPKG